MPRPKKSPASPPPPTAELLHPLPGEQAVDDGLLDQAVAHINRVYTVKGLETAREIGEFVLATFFDGDPEAFRRKEGEHASFRALAKRSDDGDLHVSHTFIWRAVSIVDQLRLLPENVRDILPYTHQTLLLPVRDAKAKVRLAEKAAEGGWSKRRLGDEVAKVRAREKGDSKAGRPRTPLFVKAIGRLAKLLVDDGAAFGELEKVEDLKADDALRLYQAVTGMKTKCEAMQKALAVKVPGLT